jgi:prepilin-type N-terminal cleavage/methylation domain-containing protein
MNKKGFTLVEILLVTAIFASIGLAVFSCLSNGLKLWTRSQTIVADEDIVVFCKGTPLYYPQMIEGKSYNKGIRKTQSDNDVYGKFKQVEVKSDGKRYPRSVQYFKTAESEGKTWQKTQKPIELCKYIIQTYSKEGDTILDFTAGSGTVAVGFEIGRNVILVEKNIKEFENLKLRWNI